MENINSGLIKFWKILNFESIKATEEYTSEDAYQIAMKETIYEPISERFCIIKSPDFGYFLLEASGSVIIKQIEAGSMLENK